jgi:hypothetical protein
MLFKSNCDPSDAYCTIADWLKTLQKERVKYLCARSIEKDIGLRIEIQIIQRA